MGKVFKGLGIGLAVIVGLLVVAVVALNVITASRLNKVYSLPTVAANISLSSDADAIARGKHLTAYRCVECHGSNFGGSTMLSDPMLGTINATNIASGIGKNGLALSDEDFVRVLRHGLDIDGKPLFIMPAQVYQYLSDQDLNDIIAYVRSLPPVADTLPKPNVAIIGRALLSAGVLGQLIPAEAINHQTSQAMAGKVETTAAYGDYLVKSIGCRDCHGENLAGAKVPGPGNTMAPNLTPKGDLGKWTVDDFIKAIRTGTTPDGRHLSPTMPWVFQGQMTDDELKSIFLYLHSVP